MSACIDEGADGTWNGRGEGVVQGSRRNGRRKGIRVTSSGTKNARTWERGEKGGRREDTIETTEGDDDREQTAQGAIGGGGRCNNDRKLRASRFRGTDT